MDRLRSPLLATLALVSLTCLGADWPQFLGPNRDGHASEKGLAATWPKGGPPILWQRSVGPGFAGPVVAEGRLILFQRVGAEEVLECLDAADGKQIWKQAYACTYRDNYGKGDGPRSTPLIAGKSVFSLGAAGRLSCVNLADGKNIWHHDLLDEYKVPPNFFGIGTTPLLEGDLVLVNVGGTDAGVVAFRKDTGKEAWRSTSQGASYASPIAVTIDGVRQVIFFTRQGFLALDPKTGTVLHEKRWRSRSEASVNAATPIVVGARVFLTTSYNTGAILLKVSSKEIQEIWKGDDSLSAHFTTPVYVDGYLYGSDGRQEEGGTLALHRFRHGPGKMDAGRIRLRLGHRQRRQADPPERARRASVGRGVAEELH